MMSLRVTDFEMKWRNLLYREGRFHYTLYSLQPFEIPH